MNDEKHIDLITAYLDGSITAEQRARLNDLIDHGEIDILDVKQMESTYKSLGNLPAEAPSRQMRDSFYAMLKEEKVRQNRYQPVKLINKLLALLTPGRLQNVAVAGLIFLVGMLAGNVFTPFQDYRQQLDQLTSEVSQMRQVMALSLLDARSPTERLKAVNISTELTSANNRVITALLKTLNNDPNVNVRLASIEALLRHAGNPNVRSGLVKAISRQQSPQIQVALADAMLALQETRSVDELRKLLDQTQLDTTVKDKLKNTIAALNKENA